MEPVNSLGTVVGRQRGGDGVADLGVVGTQAPGRGDHLGGRRARETLV